MYYYEQKDDRGRWWPRSSWTKPIPNPVASLRAEIRGLVRVSAAHEECTIEELAGIYGTREAAE